MTTEKAIDITEQYAQVMYKEVYVPSDLKEALRIVLAFAKHESIRPKSIDSGLLVDVEYLMEVHPELSIQEAQELFTFLFDSTIRFKTCYGNGEIMYPRWIESKQK